MRNGLRSTELHEALERQPDDPELIEAIRSLVDRIVLTPEGESLRIDSKGALEGIYEVSAIAAKQEPASPLG